MANTDPRDVTIVTVTWNSAAAIPDFLQSLPSGLEGVESYELVVVDNGSSDDTVEVVRRMVPTATVVETGRNGGYAAGINAGVAAADQSEAVLISNPDVRLGRGCVRELLDAAAADADIGIAVPRIVNDDNSLAFTLRREPTVRRALGDAVMGGQRAGRWVKWGELVVDPSLYDRDTAAAWASGALLLVTRECLEVVGGWDESYFLYSEETDFALRARERAFAIRLVPDASAVHVGGVAHTSPELWALLVRNRVRLYGRRHGPLSTALFRLAVLLGESVRALGGRATSRAAVKELVLHRTSNEVAS